MTLRPFTAASLAAVLFLAAPLLPADAARPSAFTAAERQQVEQIVTQLGATCDAEVKGPLRQQAAANGTDAWVTSFLDDGYCSCLTTTTRKRITPALLRTGSDVDGRNLVQRAGQDCAVQRFRKVFPGICEGWFKETLARGTVSPARMMQACGCARKKVDAMPAESLDTVTRATVADYRAHRQATGSKPPRRADSLYSTLLTCYEAGN